LIGSTTAASGGDGSITYKWQSSTTSASSGFSDIASTNTATYDPPSGLTVTTWYRRLAKDGTCNTTFTASTGVRQVTISTGVYTGVDGDYSNGANWSCGIAPSSGTIVINSGSGRVTIDQDLTITGTLNYNASGPGDTLVIAPGVMLRATTGGTINLNGHPLLIQSNASGTGSIGQITGALNGATNVTVERYLTDAIGKRGWRIIAIPLNGTQNLHDSWQEGAANASDNPHPGYGTKITINNHFNQDCFDATTPSSSLLQYNVSRSRWEEFINNTCGPNAKVSRGSVGDAWMVYIRGSRAIDVNAGSTTGSDETILRAHGPLYTPAEYPVVTVPTTTLYGSLVGNIVPCEIDFDNLNKSGSIQTQFKVWDPNLNDGYALGGYVRFENGGGGWTATPSSGGSYGGVGTSKIQSGMGFFVVASGSTGTVQITEASKSNGKNVGGVGFRPSNAIPTIHTKLYNTVNAVDYLTAETRVFFDPSFNNAVDVKDLLYSGGTTVGLGIMRDGATLVSEQRNLLASGDYITYSLFTPRKNAYKLEIVPSSLNITNGVTAILEDNYLNTATGLDLSVTTPITFDADPAIAASYTNRFRIVFTVPTPVSVTNVNAQQKNTAMQISWKAQVESGVKQYEVERSSDGTNFIKAGTVAATANNGGAAVYSFLDAAPTQGVNYYRIKTIDLSGTARYTYIVKVTYGNTAASITLTATVISNNSLSLQLNNQPKGQYGVRVLNSVGQQLVKTMFEHQGGNSTQSVSLPYKLTGGIYLLEVKKPDGIKIIEKIVIN
jgi:hypothetical protein